MKLKWFYKHIVTDYFSIQGGIFSLLWTDDLTLSTAVIRITSTTLSENCVSSVSQLVSTTRYPPSVFGPVSTTGGLDTVATILISALVVVLLVVMVSVPVCVLLIVKHRRSHHSPELHNKTEDSQTGNDQVLTGNKLHGDADQSFKSTNKAVMYESIDELLEQTPVLPRGCKQFPLEELHKEQDSDLIYVPVDEYITYSAAAVYYSNDDVRVDCIPANPNSAYGVTLGGHLSDPNIDTSSNVAYGVATSNAITNGDNNDSNYL